MPSSSRSPQPSWGLGPNTHMVNTRGDLFCIWPCFAYKICVLGINNWLTQPFFMKVSGIKESFKVSFVRFRPPERLTQTQLVWEEVISSLLKKPYYPSGSQDNSRYSGRALNRQRVSHLTFTNSQFHGLSSLLGNGKLFPNNKKFSVTSVALSGSAESQKETLEHCRTN